MEMLISALISSLAPYIMDIVITLLIAFFGIILSAVFKPIIAWVRNKKLCSDNNLVKSSIELIENAVKSAVKSAEQTVVVKEKNGNSKLTPSGQEIVRKYVVSAVIRNLPENVLLNAQKYNIDTSSLIETFIEKAVNEMKK